MTTVCHPLTVQRFGRKGWFFLSCEDIPGISLFGPDMEELIESAEIAIAELLKQRGEKIVRVTIEHVPEGQDDVTPAWAIPNQHMALAIAA
jgi:predicted RNase H-like HicB family nuclease